MDIPQGEVVFFDVVTHNPSTGAVSDADSTPTFDVYEEDTDAGMLGATNLTKRTSLTGNYRGTFTSSSGNGFEVGKFYSVIASATVNAVAGKTVAYSFRCAAAENTAGYPLTDCAKWNNLATVALPLTPATAGRTLVVDAAGLADANMVKLGPTGTGTAQTARDIGTSVLLSAGTGAGQLDFTSGVVKANATQWLGGTIPAVNVTGVPLVDAKYLLGTIFATPATAGIPDVNVKNINNVAAATPGASGGVLISGSNSGTTTLGALTVTGTTTLAALSMTTLTASGAVAFQSTFAVTTSTSLAALSCTTLTASGAVAFQSTFAVTTSTALAALSCTTLTASGAVAFQSTFATTGTTTFNAFTITNVFTVSGATTLTGAVTATNGSNDIRGVALAANQHVIVDSGTITNYTGNTPQTGDTYALANGAAGFVAIASYIDTEVAAIKAKTDNLPASPAATADCITAAGVRTAVGLASANLDTQLALRTGFKLASDGLDLVLVAGKTLPASLLYIGASVSGVVSGAGTGTEVFKDFAGATAFTVTVDASGNRSAVVYA